MNFQEMLDNAKAIRGYKNDSELAKGLGLSRQAISSWRKGPHLPDVETCEKIAKILGEKPLSVIAEIESMRAIKPAQKAIWKRIAQAALLAGIVLPPTAQAAISTGDAAMHYAKLNIGRNQ